MADVAGAVRMFCNVRHDMDLPAVTVHDTTNDPPALPPRMPKHNTLSAPSYRQPRSRSCGRSTSGSSGSVVSPDDCAVAKESPTRLPRASLDVNDSLDVFIPLSGDAHTLSDGNDITVSVQDESSHQVQCIRNSSESEQTAVVNVTAEHPAKDEDGGLDVVIGLENKTGIEKHPSLDSPESVQMWFVNASADSHKRLDDNKDISEDRSQYVGPTSRRTRPNIGRRLTRKETSKLSRKLTRKMSCRQQHALMMTAEFDEFDELDVVVEMMDNEDNEDDVDGRKLSAVSSGGEEKGDEPENVCHSVSSDVRFDERVAAKLQYDRLQVAFLFLHFWCHLFKS